MLTNSEIIYVYQDPQGVLGNNYWQITVNNWYVYGYFRIFCTGTFTLIAESPGYTSAISPTFTKLYDSGCLRAQITASPALVYENQYITIDSLLIEESGYIYYGISLEFIEIGENEFYGLSYFIINEGSTSTQIAFYTPGVKKMLAIFDYYFSYFFSVIVSDCMIKPEVTFPYGFVIIIQPLHTFAIFTVQVNIFDCITGDLNTDGAYDFTISSVPSGLTYIYSERVLVTYLGIGTIKNLYFITSGDFEVTATNSALRIGISTQFTVLDTIFIINFTSALVKIIQPSTIASLFDIKVEVYSSDLMIKFTETSYYVELSIQSLEQFMGGFTVDGEISFTNLSIASQGEFYLVAYVYAYTYIDDYGYYNHYCYTAYSDIFVISNIYLCQHLPQTVIFI